MNLRLPNCMGEADLFSNSVIEYYVPVLIPLHNNSETSQQLFENIKFQWNVWGFRSCGYEECRLMWYEVMQLFLEPTFRNNVSTLSSGCKESALTVTNNWRWLKLQRAPYLVECHDMKWTYAGVLQHRTPIWDLEKAPSPPQITPNSLFSCAMFIDQLHSFVKGIFIYSFRNIKHGKIEKPLRTNSWHLIILYFSIPLHALLLFTLKYSLSCNLSSSKLKWW
jgi:hypothetical protein